jgi:flagellar export protein FliJ
MTPKTLKRTLAIKERLRAVRRAELQEAESLVAEAQHRVDEENARHAGTCAQLTRAGEFSANDLVLASEQIAASTRSLKRARTELDARESEREDRKSDVGEATREVRAIEALHTRLVTEQRKAAEHREQLEADEAAARKGRSE